MPFTHTDIKRVTEFINPKYIVYEFGTDSIAILENSVKIQNEILLK